MGGVVKGHVVGAFPRLAAIESGPLSIEAWAGASIADGTIKLLLHPVDPLIHLTASVGSVVKGDVAPVTVPAGVLMLSGGRSASLPKRPYYSTPIFATAFAFDLTGNPTTISLTYDPLGNQLLSNKDCYSLVSYTSYTTRSTKLSYTPAFTSIGIHGSSVTYGVVAAYLAPDQFVTHQVDPVTIVNGNSLIEIYRIVSDAVTTPDGQFEKPPKYPTDGVYPDSDFTIDPATSLLTQRVHEIGMMDLSGRGFSNSYFVRKLEPYIGNNDYVIPLRCIEAVITDNRNLALNAKNYIASRGMGCKE